MFALNDDAPRFNGMLKKKKQYGLSCSSSAAEFSSGRLGASHMYSDGDSGLADETK